MSRSLLIGAGVTALLTAAALAPGHAAETSMQNPLLPKWTGPYGGVPPFDKVKVEHFKPALEAAMAETLKEIDAIADDPAPPTFENTHRRDGGRRADLRPRAERLRRLQRRP